MWHIYDPELSRRMGNLWIINDGWDQLLQWLNEKDKVDIWLNIVWLIWNNRNHCYRRYSCRVPNELVRTANQIKQDFLLGRVGEDNASPTTNPIWIRPQNGKYKVNVDAAYVSEFKEACLGMVIRDSLGSVQWSAVKRIGHI